MPAKWTGKIVGLLHVNRITQKELAKQLGVSQVWVSNVLSSDHPPADMEQRMTDAVTAIIAERKKESANDTQSNS